jgi:8-oxo-dGTP pyrophosphatase MutT (NUDIX family)
MTTEAVARPAATILLLRDGADGMEVFMVVRHHAIDFASGAIVFPGGRVDEGDHALAAYPGLCPNPEHLTPEDLAFRVAAIRETYEECGVLLARPRGQDGLISGRALMSLDTAHRADLAAGSIGFDRVLADNTLVAAPDLLIPFAHWITPSHQPKRYDTKFFLTIAPDEHLAVHDGEESVDSLWIRPSQVLEDKEAGRFKLVFATEMNVRKLTRYTTVADTIAAARAEPVVTVLPRVSKLDGTRRRLTIPIEAGYGASEFIVDNPPAS